MYSRYQSMVPVIGADSAQPGADPETLRIDTEGVVHCDGAKEQELLWIRIDHA